MHLKNFDKRGKMENTMNWIKSNSETLLNLLAKRNSLIFLN